jgi:hypothetical protein
MGHEESSLSNYQLSKEYPAPWNEWVGKKAREEIKGDWRQLHNEELYNFYYLPNIKVTSSRRNGWTEHVARTRERRNRYILVEKPDGKRPLGKGLRETGFKVVD